MKPSSRRLGMCTAGTLLAVALLLALGLTMSRARDDLELTRITVASDNTRDSLRARLSADGTLVAFDSDSDFLRQHIPDDQTEVWLYDRTTRRYIRITHASASDRDSYIADLSANGNLLALTSDSDFLGQRIIQGQFEVWLFDRTTRTFTRMTHASDRDRDSYARSLSADGKLLAFESDSDLLGQDIPDEQWEIWLYDAVAMTYTRVTTASDATRSSGFASLSADGTLLAFSSDSDFLRQGIEDEQSEIWLYDISTRILTRVTHAPDSSRGSFGPSLSGDGTKLTFVSDVDFFGQGIAQSQYEVWLYDVASAALTRVTTASDSGRRCDFPTLNADGSRVAFESDSDFFGQNIPDSHQEIWLYDLPSSALTRVTVGSEPFRRSRRPSLTADGTQVAFQSSSDFFGQGVEYEQYEIWLSSLPGPAVSLVKAVDEHPAQPGQRITYTLSVVNPLSITLTGAVVSDTLHPWLVFAGPVRLDPPQPGANLADDPGDLPILARGLTIDAETTVTLTFPVTVSAAVPWNTVITNTASLTSTQMPTPTFGSVVVRLLLQVTDVDPSPNSHDASLDADLTFRANDTVSTTTVTTKTVFVHGGFQGHLDGAFSFGSVSFDPDADLHPGEMVQASVTDGVLAGDGTPIVPYVWSFRATTLGGSGVFITHPVTPTLPTLQSLGVALGDLDADGDLDAVLANALSQPESVWLNDGSGGLSPHSTSPGFGTGSSYGVVLGDINGDGSLDALVTNAITDTVWLNDGTGNFAPHPTAPDLGTNSSRRAALGDLDGDGDLDAVVIHSSQPDTVWMNDGAGSFSAHATTPGIGVGSTSDVELGDLDVDGDLDALVVSRSWPDTVWLNDGAGNLRFRNTFGSGPSSGLAAGDLDGDGDLDVVVARPDRPQTVWLNDGTGNLSPHPTIPSFGAGDSQDVALGDLDGDGDLDALVANSDSQPQTVWLNDGGGGFTAHPDGPDFGGGYSSSIALGDLDGDGDLDAVIGDSGSQDTTVWLNRDRYAVMLPLLLNSFSATH